MKEYAREDRRSRLGFGSSYRKGFSGETARDEIKTVLGGQVWMIRPDKKAAAANPCIWMQAGVVDFKGCNNFYDCNTCKYDVGMKKQVDSGKNQSWQDAMRRRPAMERVCRHSLTHRIEKRACALDYRCGKCDFDQYFEEVWSAKTKTFPQETHQIKGFDVPMNYHFHNGHAWARIESGGFIRIGLDDFALKVLGQADALDLPLMGKEFDQGHIGWGIKRRDNLADVLSPVGGVIVEVNPMIRENPSLANREPYGEGWLFLVRNPNIKDAVKNLTVDAASISWMNEEVTQLENLVEEVAGPLAADGGYFQSDVYGNLPGLDWRRLTKTFLRT